MSWRDLAACRRLEPGMFHDPARYAEAVAICEPCPVRSACLTEALSYTKTDDPVGIWGGKTPEERARMRKQAS